MAVQLSTTNGGAIADATDSFDMMDKLLDFITGVTAGEAGKLLPVIERWVILKDDSASVAGERFVYLQGPGLSGTDSIHIAIRVYSDIPDNIHNWEIRGATGFNAAEPYDNQPNSSLVRSFLTLSNAVMPFWLVANGRRFILVIQTAGSVSYAGYFGWYLPYSSPSEFPYPMFNGGSTPKEDIGYLSTAYQVGNFYDGPRDSDTASVGQLRHRDGSWLPVAAYDATTSATRPALRPTFVDTFIWPHDQGGAAANYGLSLIENTDGSFPVLPFILYSELNGGNIYGELDGVSFSPLGLVGKKFPDTITITSDTYLVINNTFRTAEANAVLLLT